MKIEKYLPIGTIVLLKNAKKRIMISGFYVIGNNGVQYDYCGCLYPEGFLSSDKCLLFNHDQIDKIFYFGFSDDEDKVFKEKISDLIRSNNNTLS